MGADPLQAIASPRLHSQLLPDVVGAETHSILGANFYVPGTTIEVTTWLADLMLRQSHAPCHAVCRALSCVVMMSGRAPMELSCRPSHATQRMVS